MDEGNANRQPVTFDRLAEIGFGWLQLTEVEFWEMSIHAFNLRLKGWQENREAQSRETWEQIRQVVYAVILPHTDAKKRPSSAVEVMPFPWDEKAKSNQPDPEEIREQLRKAKEVWGLKLSPKLEQAIDKQA